MAKFHITKAGNPAPCKASVQACPRGGENEHYDSRQAALAGYEEKMKRELPDTLSSDSVSKSSTASISYSTKELIAQLSLVEITQKVKEELIPSEFGGEFIPNSVKLSSDGESFTLISRGSFTFEPRVGRHFSVRPGDTVTFDRNLNMISVSSRY